MKNKNILLLSAFFTVIIALTILLNVNSNKNNYIYSTNNSFVGVIKEDYKLNIHLFLENEKTSLNKKEMLEHVSISDKNKKIKFSININDIKEIKKISLINKELIEYVYELIIPNFKNDIYIQNAYLNLSSYLEEVSIKIGTIHLLYDEIKELDVEGLYGITNIYDDNTEYLAAICLKISNKNYDNILEIISYDEDYVFDLENAKILLKNDFAHNIELSKIYDNYDIFDVKIDNKPLKIDDYYILIPIKYKNIKYLSNFSFIVNIDNNYYNSPMFNYFNILEFSYLKEYLTINEVYNI